MSRILSIRPISVVFLLFIHVLISGAHAADKEISEILPQFHFIASDAPMVQVEQGLEKARKQDKLLLVVLGAEWCHDSKALAKQFSTEDMQAVLQDKYITQFIDVGFLQDRRDITQRFGYPTYFGTPTVLAIDPDSEALLNFDAVRPWQDSARKKTEEFVSYFAELQPSQPLVAPDNADFKQYVEQNMTRLHNAYRYLGPLLEMDENDTLVNKNGFYSAWNEVWKYRSALQQDLTKIYLQFQNEKPQDIEYPTYAEMSWEAQ